MYRALFVGRSDVFAVQQEDGAYYPERRKLTDEDLTRHLDGEWSIGTYTVKPGNITKVLVFDIDSGEQAHADALKLTQVLAKEYDTWDDQWLLEFSGRKGYHIWLFLEDWSRATLARDAALAVAERAGLHGLETFPKQGSLSENKPLGSLIKLPFGKHAVNGRWSKHEGGAPLEELVPLSPTKLEAMAKAHKAAPAREPRPFAQGAGESRRTLPCMERIATGVAEGGRDWSMYLLAIGCNRDGVPEDQATEYVLAANDKCDPPLPEHIVREKVRRVYAQGITEFNCQNSVLHQVEKTLCSTACPRYRQSFGLATQDGHYRGRARASEILQEVSAVSYSEGEVLELAVLSITRRKDKKLVLTLDYEGNECVLVLANPGPKQQRSQ